MRDNLGGIQLQEEEKFKDIAFEKSNKKDLIQNTTSLLYRFESIGFNYTQKDQKHLTYRDIEKALILFRNSYNV